MGWGQSKEERRAEITSIVQQSERQQQEEIQRLTQEQDELKTQHQKEMRRLAQEQNELKRQQQKEIARIKEEARIFREEKSAESRRLQKELDERVRQEDVRQIVHDVTSQQVQQLAIVSYVNTLLFCNLHCFSVMFDEEIRTGPTKDDRYGEPNAILARVCSRQYTCSTVLDISMSQVYTAESCYSTVHE